MIINCDQCGNSFDIRPSKVKKQINCFCSRECYWKHKGRNKIRTFCERCGQLIIKPPSKATETNFCSRSCHMKTYNERHNKDRMTLEVRLKLSAARTKPDSKSYAKILGVHAHRTAAEQALGRPLAPGEVVHHDDGDKRNFAPSNLRVFASQAEHARWHKENDWWW